MDAKRPLLTRRFDLAFSLASCLHHAQLRKKTKVPYIAHLMGVAALVLEADGDEDQAIAALLHDAAEDQGGKKTLATIRQLFGDRVAKTVEECSDSLVTDPNKKLPWHRRKHAYLKKLPHSTPDALLVSLADKLQNVHAMVRDHRRVGEELWDHFSKQASKQDRLDYYRSLVTIFRKTSAPPVLVNELDEAVTELEQLAALGKHDQHAPSHAWRHRKLPAKPANAGPAEKKSLRTKRH